MKYVVEGADGSRVEVDAVDWMMAMARAIAQLGIEVSGWACQTRPDGTVVVVDPMTGRSWTVQEAEGASPVSSGIIEGRTVAPQTPDSAHDLVARTAVDRSELGEAASAPPAPSRPSRPSRRPSRPSTQSGGGRPDRTRRSRAQPTFDPEPEPPSVDPAVTIPPQPPPELSTPTLQLPDPPARPAASARPTAPTPEPAPPEPRPAPVPAPSTPLPSRKPTTMYQPPPEAPEPEDLAERLFDLTMELTAAADPHDACRRALDVSLNLVPCEAGSVLRGGLNDAHLTFVAVAGPAAPTLLNSKLPFGRGIVGASFDLGITIGVDDVGADPRHASEVDQQTGFRTRSVLCVPVQGRQQYHGAIQLLNPMSGRFTSWHRDALEQLAASLATTLDGL